MASVSTSYVINPHVKTSLVGYGGLVKHELFPVLGYEELSKMVLNVFKSPLICGDSAVFFGTFDGKIKSVTYSDMVEGVNLQVHNGGVNQILFDIVNGANIISCGRQDFKVISTNVGTGQQVWVFSEHSASVSAIVMLGQFVYSCGMDGNIFKLSQVDGTKQSVFKNDTGITSMCFDGFHFYCGTADGRYIVLSSSMSKIKDIKVFDSAIRKIEMGYDGIYIIPEQTTSPIFKYDLLHNLMWSGELSKLKHGSITDSYLDLLTSELLVSTSNGMIGKIDVQSGEVIFAQKLDNGSFTLGVHFNNLYLGKYTGISKYSIYPSIIGYR